MFDDLPTITRPGKEQDWVAQLVRASPQFTEIVGWIPSRGTSKSQPMEASVSGTTNPCFSPIFFF